MQRISCGRGDYCKKHKKRVREKNRQAYYFKRELPAFNTEEETRTVITRKII